MLAKNHYDDCPYHCNDSGKILDTTLGQLIDCPFCSKRKKELLAKGYVESEDNNIVPLSTVLGIENPYLSTKFSYDSVVPDGELLFIEDESVEWQRSESQELYYALSIGQLPEISYCFGISVKGRIDRFAYPMLAKGYLNNLSVAPFISCTEYCRKVVNISEDLDLFLESDLVLMLINDGASLADISSAKGLMQARALKNRPTIFVSTWTIEACSGLLGYKDDTSLFLAKPVFLKYKSGKNSKHSGYINKLLGVENDMYTEESESSEVTVKSSGASGKSMRLADLL